MEETLESVLLNFQFDNEQTDEAYLAGVFFGLLEKIRGRERAAFQKGALAVVQLAGKLSGEHARAAVEAGPGPARWGDEIIARAKSAALSELQDRAAQIVQNAEVGQ